MKPTRYLLDGAFDWKGPVGKITGSAMKQPNTLSLEAVLDEPLPFAFELSFSTEGLDREPLLEISPVRLEGEISRIEKGFSLDASIAYAGRLECSRCLASYPFQAREDFSLILTKRPAAAAGGEISLEGEDFDAYFYEIRLSPSRRSPRSGFRWPCR